MHNEIAVRLRLLWCALESAVMTSVSLVLFIVTVAGVALTIVWVGIPILVVTIAITRTVAGRRRRRVAAMLGPRIDSPYLHAPQGAMLARIGALTGDPAVRRDVLWLLIDGTLGLALAIVALVEAVLDLIFWWLPPGLAARTHAAIDRSLLSVSEKSRLALRVQQLTESRAETVDTQAAELRRIERDLHDGAQARLVALGMSLALAEERLVHDPDSARALLVEARAAGSDALAELRGLVRGIHPPVLADRGLVGAVQALAVAAPMQVRVSADIDTRLPDPVESAAYFALAEGLTNVIKHASATRTWVELTRSGDILRMLVRDDGVGGADASRGTGLRGMQQRLAAFDGTLSVHSPPGGPTELVMVLPCASSLPKTLPSSVTG